jgi:hypothetical protein
MTATSTDSGTLRALIAGIARDIARAEIDEALKNLRPGGLVPYACTIVNPAASSTVPVCHIDVPFPGHVQLVTFRSAEVGTCVLNVKKRRPTQVYADALTIFGTHFPSITAATDAAVSPFSDWVDWVEADSTLYFFLTTVSGFTSLTVHLWLRATSDG